MKCYGGWGRRGAIDLEKELEESKAYVPACRVAGKDYVGGWDGRVVGARRRIDKGEVGYQCVAEGGREGVLRG